MKDEMRRIALKKIETYAVGLIDPLLLDASVDTIRSMVCDQLELRVRGFILAEEDSLRHVEIRYPATWWQHFKQRWFPKRWLKRWPVREMVHTVDVEVIYPYFRPALPMHHARLLVLDHGAYDPLKLFEEA